MDADADRIYVSTLGGASTPGGGSVPPGVVVLDRTTLEVVCSVRTTGHAVKVVAAPRLNLVYVAAAGALQVIDGTSGAVVSTARIGCSVQALAVDPERGSVYAGDGVTGTVIHATPRLVAHD